MSESDDIPEEPGVLATSSDEGDQTPEVPSVGDPVVDRIRLLFHVHPELDDFNLEDDKVEHLLENKGEARKLLHRIEDRLGL